MSDDSESEITEEIREDIKQATATPLTVWNLKHAGHPRVIMAAARKDPLSLNIVSPRFLTDDILRKLITEDGRYLEFVPTELKTKELCLMAIRKTDSVLPYIPTTFLMEDSIFYEIAIDHTPFNLSKVDDELLTPDLIRRALEKNPNVTQIDGIKEKILRHLPDYKDVPIPTSLKKKMSATHTNQGYEGVCGRHAFSRVILKNFLN